MNRRTRILVLVVLVAVGGVDVLGAAAQEMVEAPTIVEVPITVPARFSCAAKFVCGYQPVGTNSPPKEPAVKRGNYATLINIHNPWATDVIVLKKVALAAPERFPYLQLIPPTKRFRDKLPSDHAMSVDCTEIVNLLVLNGTPPAGTFIEGFLVVDSYFPPPSTSTAAELDVVTVSTTASSTGASTVNDHEVTPVQCKRLPAGIWPF